MFDKVFDLDSLDGKNGFAMYGQNEKDQLGQSLAAAGDINNDGITDFVLSAVGVNQYRGNVYVVFGSSIFPSVLDLNNLNGKNGFWIIGSDQFGISVNGAGDLNQDNIADIIVGANFARFSGKACGGAYVLFGQRIFPPRINILDLTGKIGFSMTLYKEGSELGFSVNTAGDINGDGVVEVLAGGIGVHPDPGIVCVVSGQKTFPSQYNLNGLNGKNGFLVPGLHIGDQLGSAVSSAGDMNGDGIKDFIVGAFGNFVNNNGGRGYVIFGQKNFSAQFDLRTLNGTNGFLISKSDVKNGDMLGWSVNTVGDINGDGKNDIAITAPHINNITGATYIIYGQLHFNSSSFDLNTLNGKNGFTINGLKEGDGLGVSISSAGDINGDGKADLLIGAGGVNNTNGMAYVILGRESFPAKFDLTTLNGSTGFYIPGKAKQQLNIVTTVGDLNNDGIDDIAVGASFSNNSRGSAYVIFGKFPLVFDTNQMSITQGESIVVSAKNLRATDLNGFSNLLNFKISGIQGGKFILNRNSSDSITSFYQQNITDRKVSFMQDGSPEGVSYIVEVTNGAVSTKPENANITFQLAPPTLVNNQISIKQGKTTVLTSENLSATDLNFPVGTLMFSVSNIEGGQFERVNKPDVSIKTFNQQEIIDKQIQFAQDDSKGAGYEVIVTDGNDLSAVPSKANVTFIARPILWRNGLFVKQGSSVVLTTDNINATDDDTPDSGLVITASNVMHGQFEYNNQPDIAIDHFTQENITQLAVRFKTDGGYEKPSYDLTVKDEGDLTDGPKAADVTFHDKPRMGNNQLTIRDGQTVVVSHSDLSATEGYTPEAALEFEISNIEHGEFQWKNNSNNAKTSLAITKFFQKNITDQQVQFMHDGSGIAPNYAVSVSDGELTSGSPENATINFQDSTPIDNGLKIGLGVLGGTLLLAAVGAVSVFSYKKWKRSEEEDKLLNAPGLDNPTINEKDHRKDDKQNQKDLNCQLF